MMRHRIFALFGVGLLAIGTGIGACVSDDASTNDGGADATFDSSTDSGGNDATPDVDSGACQSGETLCGQTCVKPSTDPNNCGTCNHKCNAVDGGQFACTGGKCGDAIVDVTVSANHACVVLLDGSVWCWGSNIRGEMGVPLTTTGSVTPMKAQIDNVARIASNENDVTCAVKKDNTVWCWGYNPGGMLGHPPGGGSPADVVYGNGQYINPVPQQVGGLVPSDEVVLEGSGAVCARSLTGGVTCWGILMCGVLGTPDAGTTTGSLPTAVAGVSGVAHLAKPHAGDGECVVGDAGALVCWGDNTYGQTGHAPEATPPFCAFNIAGSVSPPSTVSLTNVTSVTNNDNSSVCATTSGGQLYCWGYLDGLLGADASAAYPTPALVTTGTTAKALKVVSAGAHLCTLFDDNTVRCWGSNGSGQLGVGQIDGGALYPPTKANVSNAVDVFAGGSVTAALLSDGSLAIWGSNASGMLAHTPGTANDIACGGNQCNPTPSIVSGIP